MKKCLIAGGGAAGMMAAITAARNGNQVILFEKNEKLGKKLFITGKGRCNFTNAGDSEDIFNSVVTNRKFLYSAFNGFSNYDTMGFFDELGLAFKIERGNRVFPESDHSSDVIGALQREMKKLSVEVHLNTEVVQVCHKDGRFTGLRVKDTVTGSKRMVQGDALIIATGGNSYQSTGSTGDGYRFAKELGHEVTPILPALVPFIVKEEWERELQGLSLKNVTLSLIDTAKNKPVYREQGEMLFTHFGVSGPLVLSASAYVKKSTYRLEIDLKPALDDKKLDARLLRDFSEQHTKQISTVMRGLLPQAMVEPVLDKAGVAIDTKISEITKMQRAAIVNALKHFDLTVTGLRPIEEAIITDGGVSLKEIDPKTMGSKLIDGLYFAGEIIDCAAYTGGYNLQIAFSTAHSAAAAVSRLRFRLRL